MTKIWKLGCGDEVKGEGYILTLILYSFFIGFLEKPKNQQDEKMDFGKFSIEVQKFEGFQAL